MKIIEVTKYHDEFLEALNTLLPQLSSDAKPLSRFDLMQIIASDCAKLLLAVDNRRFSGALTLVLFKTPTGMRARIEDLIVDGRTRGKGVGKTLIRHAIALAKEAGADTVDLTSHPSRKAANALYKKMGFEASETNVYHYTIA